MLRSAATHPWYIKTFESLGFKCEAAAIRESGSSIDRVNMYASTWVCTNLDGKEDVVTVPSDITKLDAGRRRMSSLKI